MVTSRGAQVAYDFDLRLADLRPATIFIESVLCLLKIFLLQVAWGLSDLIW